MCPLLTLSLLFFFFYPKTSQIHISPSLLISSSPFCLPSLQCNADFSQGGGMVEIGGVPWIIVEDIFTLTHFGVPFAPLKGAAALNVLSQQWMFKWVPQPFKPIHRGAVWSQLPNGSDVFMTSIMTDQWRLLASITTISTSQLYWKPFWA